MTKATYLQSVGDKAAVGAPDDSSAEFRRQTAVAKAEYEIDQALGDYEDAQRVKEEFAAASG